jgi:DNA-binding NtrC family response regulator
VRITGSQTNHEHKVYAGARGIAAPAMVGGSAAMSSLRTWVDAVAHRRCTVLIQGETGTGKELVARHIHAGSRRGGGPFVPVDCSTLPQTLFESQMFGHVKGAFTGAQQSTLGFIRSAGGGTLFLDEIGELPLAAQAKLLRCIQERVVVPVGSAKPIEVDVRIIAATHRNLREMADEGTFREDLYYRIDVVKITTPPLRERVEDIASLAVHFITELAALYGEADKRLGPGVIEALIRYGWPGNVRELSNAIEHAYILNVSGEIVPEDLPGAVTSPAPGSVPMVQGVATLEQVESELIARALRASGGNQSKASQLTGIERHRLRRKIIRYGLESLTRPNHH